MVSFNRIKADISSTVLTENICFFVFLGSALNTTVPL